MSQQNNGPMRQAMDKVRSLEQDAERNSEIHSRMLSLMYMHEKNIDHQFFLEMLSLMNSLKPIPRMSK